MWSVVFKISNHAYKETYLRFFFWSVYIYTAADWAPDSEPTEKSALIGAQSALFGALSCDVQWYRVTSFSLSCLIGSENSVGSNFWLVSKIGADWSRLNLICSLSSHSRLTVLLVVALSAAIRSPPWHFRLIIGAIMNTIDPRIWADDAPIVRRYEPTMRRQCAIASHRGH